MTIKKARVGVKIDDKVIQRILDVMYVANLSGAAQIAHCLTSAAAIMQAIPDVPSNVQRETFLQSAGAAWDALPANFAAPEKGEN